MNIRSMKKAELIELVEQLNEAREHTDAVINVLRAENAALRATPQPAAHEASTHRVRNAKLVHEFDPDIPGSYVAAMARARELGGIVRRAKAVTA